MRRTGSRRAGGYGQQAGRLAHRSRHDPALPGSVGDIGTHAFNLAEFITGDEVADLCADLHTFVEGRRLDDNAHMMLRFACGAQACSGAARSRRVRKMACGSGLRREGRARMAPGKPERAHLLAARRTSAPDPAQRSRGRMRFRARRPAFRRASRRLSRSLRAALHRHRRADRRTAWRTGIRSVLSPGSRRRKGVRGVRFIDAAVQSSQRKAAWVSL